MNKLSSFFVLLLFFCFSALAAAQTQGKELIYLDVGEESFGGLYYPASKGDTKSHIWYSHEKILSALYGVKSQFYTAFDTVWPAATGTPYPGDRYLPTGKWFVPLLHQKQPEPRCTATEIEKLLETNIGEINNSFSLGLNTLQLENNLTVKAIMTGILTLKEEDTTQGELIDGLLVSVGGLSDRVESLGKSLDEKLAQLQQSSNNSNHLFGKKINTLKIELAASVGGLSGRVESLGKSLDEKFRQLEEGGNSNIHSFNRKISTLEAKLASRQQGVDSKLREIIGTQEALIAQLQERDQRMRLQNKIIDTELAIMKKEQDLSRHFEIAALILLVILIWLALFQIILGCKHQKYRH